MGKIIIKNQPCLNPECGSSDGRQIYDDETSFCFSCKGFFDAVDGDLQRAVSEATKSVVPTVPRFTPYTPADIVTMQHRGFEERAIKRNVAEFYDVRVAYDTAGKICTHFYPYEEGTAWKIRKLPKEFSWTSHSDDLFGRERFAPGGKRLYIAEGEMDTMALAQCIFDQYGKFYPAVGLSSSSMMKSLLKHREWIRSFGEVILCLDNDEAGQKATLDACKIIGVDKVKLIKLPVGINDISEMLMREGSKPVMQMLFDAAIYIPSGIIGKDALWAALVEYNSRISVPYPDCLRGVNTKLKGKRGGEIALFISGTGSGKSTLLREDMLYNLQNTPPEVKIGVVSLEESPPEYARKMAGMVLNRNPARDEIPLEELEPGFQEVFGSDRVVLLDHQGSMNDTSLIDQLEYMCLSGCKYIYIDHITIAISEGVDGLTGNEAQDKFMNGLLRLVKRYPDVWIGLVSHLRKTSTGGVPFEEGKLPSLDDIRGSGSVKQVSFDIIAFARNLTADNDKERNTIKIRVLKSRFSGLTGDVTGAEYDYDTGRLTASATTAFSEYTKV